MQKNILNNISSVGIIGYGAMGKIFQDIFQSKPNHPSILIYDQNKQYSTTIAEVSKADLIVICVPINAFETVVKSISQYVQPHQVVLHICSVQIHPKKVLQKYLSGKTQIIGSHPMFGPQTLSYNNNQYDNLNFVIEAIECQLPVYKNIKQIFAESGFNMVEMSAEEHDKKAAKFHFLSHLIANVLTELDLEKSQIDTKSYECLFSFLDRISPNKDLLEYMHEYNPHVPTELHKFSDKFKEIKTLLDNRTSS